MAEDPALASAVKAAGTVDVAWHQGQEASAQGQARGASRRCDLIAGLRFVILVLVVLCVAAVAAAPGVWPIVGTAVSVALWMAFALVHGAMLDHRDRLRRLAAYHQHGAARCADTQWPEHSGIPATAAAEHPFAHDLDLTGETGLLARLDTCGSQRGREHLQHLFLAADLPWDAARAAAVQALQPLHQWRAALQVSATPRRRQGGEDSQLVRWAG